jgi:serine/threonine-protein kinase
LLAFDKVNAGTHIGQYRLLRKIGSGGMGAVYLAEHALLGRRAAIKTLLPSLSKHRDVVERFFNEARATSAINDPGVVQIYDFGYHVDGTAYIVMEYLEGESLDARLRRLGRLPAGAALRIARQAACALGAAHARGIVHRDLKPENLFLVRDPEAQGGERPKILDFGIAKLEGAGAPMSKTRSGAMLGTPIYMSPEQCRGAGHVDHRSDVYSLGCVLFHMLTGVPPFEGDGVGDVIAAHLREEPPAPSSLAPSLPTAIDSLLARCLAKSPDDRLMSMAALTAAIESVMARLTSPELAPPALAAPVPTPVTALGVGFQSGEEVGIPFDPTWEWPTDEPFPEDEAQPPRRTGLWAAAAILVLGGAGAMMLAFQLRHRPAAADSLERPAEQIHASGAIRPTVAVVEPHVHPERGGEAVESKDAGIPIDAPPPIDANIPIDAAPPIDAPPPRKKARTRAHTPPREPLIEEPTPAPPPPPPPQDVEDLYDSR